MRRLLVLRAIARSRRYARNPSRLCSCASRRPAAPPSRCQVCFAQRDALEPWRLVGMRDFWGAVYLHSVPAGTLGRDVHTRARST